MQNEDDVNIIKYPYVVSIKNNRRHVCSGIIINRNHIKSHIQNQIKYHIITSDRCVPPFKHVWNVINSVIIASGSKKKREGERERERLAAFILF